MTDEQLRALGDEHFLQTEDPGLQARWTKIKQRAETERRSLEEICDEVVKQEADPAVLLRSPEFVLPQLTASTWAAAEVQNVLEAWRAQPLQYIKALEELLCEADDTSSESGDTKLCDRVGANSIPYQSTFCATVLTGIRSRRS